MWLAQCVKGQHTIYVRSEKILTGARALALAPSCPRSRFPLVSCWNLSIDLKWDIDLMMCDSDKPTLIHRRRRLVLGQLDKVDTSWRLSAYLHILCLTEHLEQTESSCCQHSFLDMRSVIIRCRCFCAWGQWIGNASSIHAHFRVVFHSKISSWYSEITVSGLDIKSDVIPSEHARDLRVVNRCSIYEWKVKLWHLKCVFNAL